jgi:hypothetical protein
MNKSHPDENSLLGWMRYGGARDLGVMYGRVALELILSKGTVNRIRNSFTFI